MSLGDEKTTRDGAQLELSESQQAAIREARRGRGRDPAADLARARGGASANDAVERAHAEADPEAFWAEQAEAIEWIEPWREVLRFDLPHHEWFLGGKLNATANCIDRHVHGDRRNKAAIIWVGEDGEEHAYTYSRLYREVNRFANALKRLGRGQGRPRHHLHAARPRGDHHDARLRPDRRDPLGRLRRHGHAGAALAHRRLPGARVVVCSDYTLRRGQEDPAQADRRRGGARPRLRRARRRPPPRLAARRRAVRASRASASTTSTTSRTRATSTARRSRWTPRTRSSSSTRPGRPGEPKGVVHTTGGYMVGVTYLARAFYQIGERDIYWSHLRHRLDRRPLLHRLRAALRRRDGLLPRGRARLPDARRDLGAGRALRRERHVHRADRRAHVDEPRRRGARRTTTSRACA